MINTPLPLEVFTESLGGVASILHSLDKGVERVKHQSAQRVLHGKLAEFHELLKLGALVHFKAGLFQVEPALGDVG